MRFLALLIVLFLAHHASGAEYYVNATGGNDSRTTTEAQNPATPWLTINKFNTTGSPGDIGRVANGNYPERIDVAAHGLTFIGNQTGTGVVMQGYFLLNRHFTTIIGFEMTHTTTSSRAGVHMSGTCLSNRVFDNWIHNVHREGSHAGNGAWNIYRGNRIYYIANPGSIQLPDVGLAADAGSHHNLIEYNELQRCSDFVDWYGQSNIFRNLYLHDTDPPTYWIDNDTHPDFFQPGSDGAQTFTRHHIIERVFMGDNRSQHGHGTILQDNSGFGDTNVTVRENVLYETDGGGMGTFGTEYVQKYNNTLFNNLTVPAPPIGNLINWWRDGADGSMGGLLINTMIAFVASGHDVIYLEVDNEVFITNNWGYVAGTESSYVSTANPLFENTNSFDFRLTSASGARGAGTHLTTITNANGSGTSFGVVAKHRLKDGWGLTEGDVISFPGGATARIASVDYDTHIVTLTASISWTNGQRIYFGPRGHQADIGAYPFGAEFLTGATYLVSGGTATISTTGEARKVWRYRGGIPLDEDYDAPFTFSNHQAGDVYKAYPLYAQRANVTGLTAISGEPGPTVTTIAGAGGVARGGGGAF